MAKTSKPKFDPEAFLAKANGGVTIAKYRKGQIVFSQGDPADCVFYIREGGVKIAVVSAQGKEAVVAVGGPFAISRGMSAARQVPLIVILILSGSPSRYAHLRRRHRRSRQPPSFFRSRKPEDEERLFFCERRLRNPHAPRFPAPKIFRGAIAQYLPSRAYRLVAGSFEVREFHSYVVDVGAIIINMEIESRHTGVSRLLAGALASLCHRRQGNSLPVIYDNRAQAEQFLSSAL